MASSPQSEKANKEGVLKAKAARPEGAEAHSPGQHPG